ncbi:unnamed protein product [Urochloa humidicola]
MEDDLSVAGGGGTGGGAAAASAEVHDAAALVADEGAPGDPEVVIIPSTVMAVPRIAGLVLSSTQVLSDTEVISSLNLSFPVPPTISNFSFQTLKSLITDLDTLVPAYVADNAIRFFLALICSEQNVAPPGRVVIAPALPPGGLPLVPYPDSDDDDEVLEVEGPVPPSKKRRRHKLREPLEKDFVRRSRRLNPEVGGFRDAESQQQAMANPSVYNAAPVDASVVATHLSVSNIQGIGVNFLKMQPKAVSAAVLLDLDDDDE